MMRELVYSPTHDFHRIFFHGEDCIRYNLLTGFRFFFFIFQAEDGIRDKLVTGVQTCALPICVVAGCASAAPEPAEIGGRRAEGLLQKLRGWRVRLPALRAHFARQTLGEHAQEGRRDQVRVDAEVKEPRQRADRVVRVERAQHEVAGLGRAKGKLRGLAVPDLADHDHVRVVPEEGAQILGERVSETVVHLVLAEGVADVLDRVLGGQDLDPGLVHALERAEEGRALAGAGGTRDQDDPGGRAEELAQPRSDGCAEAQCLHGLRKTARVEDPDDGALAVIAGNDGDTKVHRGSLTAPLHARSEAPVLGPPALRDVELAEDLEPRHQPATVQIQRFVQAVEIEPLQHAVDAEPRLDPAVHGLEMNVGGATLDRQGQQLADDADRTLGDALAAEVEPAALRETLDPLEREDVRLADKRLWLVPVLVRRGANGAPRHGTGVHLAPRPPHACPAGRDDLDLETRARLEVVDDRCPRRIVHGDDQRLADARDRDDEALRGESWIDQWSQRHVQSDRGEVEEIDVELEAQHPPQLLFGDERQSDDRFPARLLPAPLLGESRRELLGGERVRLHQELPQLRAAPVALENRHELAPRQYFLRDEDVAERHIGFRLALHA